MRENLQKLKDKMIRLNYTNKFSYEANQVGMIASFDDECLWFLANGNDNLIPVRYSHINQFAVA